MASLYFNGRSAIDSARLLAKRRLDKPLLPWDGRVAAVMGKVVCTTPNGDYIPFPPLGQRDVYLRADYRYGEDDPMLWPQPYLGDYPHLGCIPTKPDDPNDPLSIMWWDPTMEDFVPTSNSLVGGIGYLAKAKFDVLETMMRALRRRIEEYKKHVKEPNATLLSLEKAMHHACVRLGSLPSSFVEMRFGVTEFQRYYLEIRAVLDYLEIYLPRMVGQKTVAAQTEHCVGIFTNASHVAYDYAAAGIPVWLLRTEEDFLATAVDINVLSIAQPIFAADHVCTAKNDPPFPTIFSGPANSPAKHIAIHRYSRTWLVFRDPFDAYANSVPMDPFMLGRKAPTESIGRTMEELMKPQPMPPATQKKGATSANIPSKRQKASASASTSTSGRDKYAPLESPMAPFTIPAWAAALKAVDRTPSRIIQDAAQFRTRGHYTFPDPGLFVTPASDDRKAKFFEAWLRLRPAWLWRVLNNASSAMSGQYWRDYLSMGYIATHNDDSAAAKRRKQIVAYMEPNRDFPGVIQPRAIVGEPLKWSGQEFLPSLLPPLNIAREILWELYELNFRYDFLALDRRACAGGDTSDVDHILARQDLLAACFPSGQVLTSVDIPLVNSGLAAKDWQVRLPFILALAQVMRTWKGPKPDLLVSPPDSNAFTEDIANELERRCAEYFTQTFFDYFGRAAMIPHRLYP